MSAELGVGLGIKIFGGTVVAFFTGAVGHLYWSIRRDKTKLDNTYTKQETEKLVNDKLEPTKQKVDAIHDLLKVMADKSDITNTSLSTMNTSIEVMKNDMTHMKDDIKDLKDNK